LDFAKCQSRLSSSGRKEGSLEKIKSILRVSLSREMKAIDNRRQVQKDREERKAKER
jgi:hypothetical protein